jgi:hypothetical protein
MHAPLLLASATCRCQCVVVSAEYHTVEQCFTSSCRVVLLVRVLYDMPASCSRIRGFALHTHWWLGRHWLSHLQGCISGAGHLFHRVTQVSLVFCTHRYTLCNHVASADTAVTVEAPQSLHNMLSMV